jgi:hypothetical protein
MNRIEQAALRPLIKRVCGHNSNLWWELKRQVWDGGYQVSYPIQDDYGEPVQRALERLAPEVLETLVLEWSKKHPGKDANPQVVRSHYRAVVIEEIVQRATAAAYRTTNW